MIKLDWEKFFKGPDDEDAEVRREEKFKLDQDLLGMRVQAEQLDLERKQRFQAAAIDSTANKYAVDRAMQPGALAKAEYESVAQVASAQASTPMIPGLAALAAETKSTNAATSAIKAKTNNSEATENFLNLPQDQRIRSEQRTGDLSRVKLSTARANEDLSANPQEVVIRDQQRKERALRVADSARMAPATLQFKNAQFLAEIDNFIDLRGATQENRTNLQMFKVQLKDKTDTLVDPKKLEAYAVTQQLSQEDARYRLLEDIDAIENEAMIYGAKINKGYGTRTGRKASANSTTSAPNALMQPKPTNNNAPARSSVVPERAASARASDASFFDSAP